MDGLVTIKGSVEEIIYTNFDNGYTVCVIDTGEDIITATGCMPYLNEGEDVEISGVWTNHPQYGEQFSVKLYQKLLPTEEGAILKYLASGLIRGIRLATAKKIVDAFGSEALNILQNNPIRLSEIKGISKSKAIEMGEAYAEQVGISHIVMFLQSYGISAKVALKVYRRFGNQAVEKVKENPYILISEIMSVGFKTADRIAMAMGKDKNDDERIKAGIRYILSYNAAANGHTYLPFSDLADTAVAMLETDPESAQKAIFALCLQNALVRQKVGGDDAVFLSSLYEAEMKLAKKFTALTNERHIYTNSEAEAFLEKWEAQKKLTLAEEQKRAVFFALRYGIIVLTGPPGTGKTTIVNAIIDAFAAKGMTIALTAPTGRAAKRMSELTGMEAKTVHRLLETGYLGDADEKYFGRDEENPLDEEVIIVDECSMLDISLASALISALKEGTRLIMVGDSDQLPPIGPGNMLSDIIESHKIPCVRLTQIFRQAGESMIIRNAHRIIGGEYPVLNNTNSDFFFMERRGGENISQTICDLVSKRLPAAYGFDSKKGIQVLSPMRKGAAGVEELNRALQAAINPPGPAKAEKDFGKITFREGDKVMQTKNNYDIEWESTKENLVGNGVFNGDMGFIDEIDTLNKQMTIIFDDEKLVRYPFNMIEELELAYAVTVHKSQGSEFDAVIVSIYPSAPMLMRRNLLYTAVTRAKKLVVLVGDGPSIYRMVDNNTDSVRYCALKSFLEDSEIDFNKKI